MKAKPIDRDLFVRHAGELADTAGDVLRNKMIAVFDKLSIEERIKFANGDQYFRLAKTILCAAGPDEIHWQFAAQAILPEIKSVKRILRHRA